MLVGHEHRGPTRCLRSMNAPEAAASTPGDVLVVGPGGQEALPDHEGRVPASGGLPCAPSTASRSTSSRVRRSGWSARAAPASRRPGARCSSSRRPPRARSCSTAPTSARSSTSQLRKLRPRMQMVFQNPHSSLNPRMTVASIIGEPLVEHAVVGQAGAATTAHRGAPRRWSGSTRATPTGTRTSSPAASASASASPGRSRSTRTSSSATSRSPRWTSRSRPRSSTCSNVSRSELGLAYLFISHDMSMVRHIADRVAVMYLGRIVELGTGRRALRAPEAPVHRALHSAVPVPDPVVEGQRERVILEGDIPSPANPPSGCPFHTRCPVARERCSTDVPEQRETRARATGWPAISPTSPDGDTGW